MNFVSEFMEQQEHKVYEHCWIKNGSYLKYVNESCVKFMLRVFRMLREPGNWTFSPTTSLYTGYTTLELYHVTNKFLFEVGMKPRDLDGPDHFLRLTVFKTVQVYPRISTWVAGIDPSLELPWSEKVAESMVLEAQDVIEQLLKGNNKITGTKWLTRHNLELFE